MGSRTLHRRHWAALAILLAAAVMVVAVGVSVALMLLPGAVLFILLAQGIRPGEEWLERLRRTRPRGRRRPLVPGTRPALPLVVARTGRLRHAALAMRPPPAVPACS
jgi:hypothetical protein